MAVKILPVPYVNMKQNAANGVNYTRHTSCMWMINQYKTRVQRVNFARSRVCCPSRHRPVWKQDVQLSQRDHAAGCISFGQKWKTRTGRLYLRTL